jgi:phosphatidyl-myo-inositol alpha-mannosyltransferase
MNIVQISPYSLGRNGGVQTHVRDLAAEFRRQGHNVLCICPGQTAGLPDGCHGVGRMRSISFAGTHFELSLATSAELSDLDRMLADFRPDIMHYHTMWVPMLPWQIFRRSRYPSIATFHDTTSSDATGAVLRAIFRPLSRYLLSRLDGALTVSPAPLAHLRPGRHGVVPAVIPPAMNLERYFAVSKPKHNEIPVVLFVGRLEPRKGITVLLEAWHKVVAAAGGARSPHLIVAGSGECAPLVAQAIQQLGADAISHREAPDDQTLRELLAMATIAVSPAIYGESFGIILVEALTTGTPVIGAANAGYVHVLTGKGCDLLVPPGDADALAARIMELIADPRQCRELGAWGREHAVQFDVRQCLPRFLSAYQQAIARHNSA